MKNIDGIVRIFRNAKKRPFLDPLSLVTKFVWVKKKFNMERNKFSDPIPLFCFTQFPRYIQHVNNTIEALYTAVVRVLVKFVHEEGDNLPVIKKLKSKKISKCLYSGSN